MVAFKQRHSMYKRMLQRAGRRALTRSASSVARAQGATRPAPCTRTGRSGSRRAARPGMRTAACPGRARRPPRPQSACARRGATRLDGRHACPVQARLLSRAPCSQARDTVAAYDPCLREARRERCARHPCQSITPGKAQRRARSCARTALRSCARCVSSWSVAGLARHVTMHVMPAAHRALRPVNRAVAAAGAPTTSTSLVAGRDAARADMDRTVTSSRPPRCPRAAAPRTPASWLQGPAEEGAKAGPALQQTPRQRPAGGQGAHARTVM